MIFSGLALVFIEKFNEKLYPTSSYLNSFNLKRSGYLRGPIAGRLGASRVPSIIFDPVVMQLRNFGKLFLDPSCGAMAEWLRSWIPNPGVLCSKPLGGSMVDSALHPSKVNKICTSFWELSGKK